MEERWFGLLTTKTNWPLKGTSVSLPFCNGPVFKTKTWGCKQVHSPKTRHLFELRYPWIWGIFPHTLKFHYVQHIILELCRPLSKQFHAPHHAFDDTAFNAHLVRLTQKVILTIPCFASLQFDAHVRNIANLDFSIYWSFMISAGLELPADLLSIVGLEQLGRYV